METEAAHHASRRANVPSPEKLRQRQRDRHTPRGCSTKASSIATSDKETQDSAARAIRQSPKSTSKDAARHAVQGKKPRNEAVRVNGRKGEKQSSGNVVVNVTPEVTSAGREGRQFTVANVGNNGRIYLRPTVKPANQRYPQPAFVFPNSSDPASNALAPGRSTRPAPEVDSQTGSVRTSKSPISPSKSALRDEQVPAVPALPRHPLHKRAFSFSTIDDQSSPLSDLEAGAFKVVIERPGTQRPRTAEELGSIPTLEVSIPSWRLGTPRFSTKGTAFLRKSSYTTTEDQRSSIWSYSQQQPAGDPSISHARRQSSRRHSAASLQGPKVSDVDLLNKAVAPIVTTSDPLVVRPRIIEPAMYDELTFKPACDDKTLVRYSSLTGGITAATPPRLIAEITSPSFLDYELLSDFFLTYRSFLAPADLLAMLIARLRWALAINNDVGMVVRVRTFVALRHWILNYFMDDFVVDYDLRLTFCTLINTFVDEILQLQSGERNQIKILGELKKCWRRTCALYWDGPDFFSGVGQQSPIAPGGVAGSRNPDLTPEFWIRPSENGPPRLDNIFDHDHTQYGIYNFFAEVSRSGHVESTKTAVPRQSHVKDEEDDEDALSPASALSEEITSCSFPSRSKVGQLKSRHHGAHPVPQSPKNALPMVFAPKSHVNKKRSAHTHQRSGSFADSLRDHRAKDSGRQMVHKSNETVLPVPFAGSLVRGNLFPPGQAFVDFVAPMTPAEANRATTYFHEQATNAQGPLVTSAPGMRKIMGSVRRILGSRAGTASSFGASPTTGGFPQSFTQVSNYGACNRPAELSVLPHTRSHNGSRGPMRIDLLGAGIAEDFKRAVREDAEADALRNEDSGSGSIGVASGNHGLFPSAERLIDEPNALSSGDGPGSVMSAGIRSLVAFDDILQAETPIKAGAASLGSSPVIHSESFGLPIPTPPCTPPERHFGTPRTSSGIFSKFHHPESQPTSRDGTPSLVHDHQDASITDQSPSYPRVLANGPSMHSYSRSKRSGSLRRYASFQSGFTRHQTDRSFDATTFTDSVGRISGVPLATPLHVLRRRPGGDLRAATNVGELTTLPFRRTRSFGSVHTYSDSLRSSFLLGRESHHDHIISIQAASQLKTPNLSLGALASPVAQKAPSLIDTHSSQPKLRPSFEQEAAKLAQIPDDANDDGGVESALLKLEGKFDEARKSRTSAAFGAELATSENKDDWSEKRRHREEHITVNSVVPIRANLPDVYRPRQTQPGQISQKPGVYQPRHMQATVQSLGTTNSAESYASVPLLQREHSSDGVRRRSPSEWRDTSFQSDPIQDAPDPRRRASDSLHSSHRSVDESASLRRKTLREAGGNDSYNDISEAGNSDAESDLSSEMSMEMVPAPNQVEPEHRSKFPPMHAGTKISELVLPLGPLLVPSSPTLDIEQALSINPQPHSPLLYSPQLRHVQPTELPPTPEVTPTLNKMEKSSHWDHGTLKSPAFPASTSASKPMAPSVHLPFILAYDSQVLAQQFTLVEKDALNEVDWKELIDMRWKNAHSTARSWVDFLRTEDARGVDVVISRFNIVCKWVVSECVLTRDLEERVQCIIKYIHIAAHCRAYRNYATLYQITVALTGTDLSKLKTTWNCIPAADMATLKSLEILTQPMRNFHNLRAEMETFAAGPCIPFIGVYTHDLLFNSQRPSVIASTPYSEPLVNFEKCRTSAAIVKSLLRLLEAGQGYDFVPVEGVTEKCLWMAALSDAEIRRLVDRLD